MAGKEAFIRKFSEVQPTPCPCGQAWRVITAEDTDQLSLHRVEIAGEAKAHYHRAHTECYVVLEGEGEIELDGERSPVAPGDMIYIPPGTRHAMRGHFTILNVVSPPFDPQDEFVVE